MYVGRTYRAKEEKLQTELKSKLSDLQDEFRKYATAKDFDMEYCLKLRSEIDTLHYKIQASKDRISGKSSGLEERTITNC